jgi:hypothetical protein
MTIDFNKALADNRLKEDILRQYDEKDIERFITRLLEKEIELNKAPYVSEVWINPFYLLSEDRTRLYKQLHYKQYGQDHTLKLFL